MRKITELLDLSGRVALITGAGGHLGVAAANVLGELGANLILVDLATKALDKIASELRSKWSVKVDCFNFDLSLQKERSLFIQSYIDNGNSLDILINNAALIGSSEMVGWSGGFEEQSVSNWPKVMEVNLSSIFHLSQGFSETLKQSSGASIINISSIYGFLGPDWSLYEGTNMGNPAAYAASKGGLIQLSKWLATTLSPGIRVNTISPGGIARGQPAIFSSKYITRTPLKRMATEQDFLGAIAYLSTDMSSYVTGHNLIVDGGWSCW